MIARREIVYGLAGTLLFPSAGRAMTCVPIDPVWGYVADTVMGGVSEGQITRFAHDGRDGMRLRGDVKLENNGGFIQMASNLDPSKVSEGGIQGISFETIGNGQTYEVGLRTTDLTRPWQSYRAVFSTSSAWTKIDIPFADFAPNRTDVPLNITRIRRIGVLAVGRAFEADVAIANLCFVR
ncbi:MAG: CIA30 family protein [Pseudomonadota bacterium]